METKRRPRMKEQVDSIKSHEIRRTNTEARLDLTNRRLLTTPEREFSPVEEVGTDWEILKQDCEAHLYRSRLKSFGTQKREIEVF